MSQSPYPLDRGALAQATELSARYHFAITQHDSTNFTRVCRAIYVGVAGDVAVVTEDDTVCVYKAVPVGTIIPVIAKRVNSTGSAVRSAGDLVGMY
jgi:ribosomal protein L2